MRPIVWLAALASLGSACDRQEQHPRVDTVARVDTLRHRNDSSARRISQDSSVRHDTSAVAEPDSLALSPDTSSHRPQRLGIVDFERGFGPCLAIAKDSLPLAAGTEVALVNIGDEYNEKAPQHLATAIILGPVDSSCGNPSAFSEPAVRLRVTTGKAADGWGIVGPIAALRIEHKRAVIRFPGDSAHWQFWRCTSREGVHYQVGRRSADSLIILWDGYYHVDYDTEPTCESERARPRANEARSLVADWNAGKHDRETAMRLLIVRWRKCYAEMGDGDSTSAVIDSSAYPRVLPPSDELRDAVAGSALAAEDAFVIGYLGTDSLQCFGGDSLWKPPAEYLADAARLEPSSALFKYFHLPEKERHGVPNDVAAELHRRFDGRGEHYRMVGEWLRDELLRR